MIYTDSGQYIYVLSVCNFFFVPQDLIDRINSYFRRKLLLIGSNTLCHTFFLMKIISLHWNGASYTCKEKIWQKICRISLKGDECHICMAQLSLQSL